MKAFNNTLVLGGTGKTGSRIVSRLTAMDRRVRIGSRTAAIPFDWENPATWSPALQGMDAVYISYQPDLAVPGAASTIQAFVKKAVESGVQQLILLSGRGEPEAQECEKIVMAAGVEWTIVRASWFCQNFSESHMLEPIVAGYVALPAGETSEPFIDADDIADVAVAALTEEKHNGNIYEVTGPRLLTFREAIAAIANAAGKNIHYEEITIEEYAAMLATHGVPDDVSSLIAYLFSEVMDGRNARITDGVERALGRRATDFSAYIKKTITTGVWDQIAVGKKE